MKFLTFLLSISFLTAHAQTKVGVTAVITVDAERNYGMGHPGNNADYIQQLRNITLPVSLIGFDAKASTDAVTIKWQTASEKNSSHFILKRAGADKNFIDLAIITAKGESSSLVNYQFLDRSPLNGINYYQLEQVDFDAAKTLSEIISINYSLKQHKAYTYFSADGVLNLVLTTSKQKDPIKLRITNISGQLLSTKSIKVQEASHYVFNDLFLNSGVYILTIEFKDQVISQKFIK